MANGASVDLSGVAEVLRGLGMAQETIAKALAVELYQRAEAVMTDSKTNYVPVDTGTLKASGYVQEPVISGSMITVTLGYGGAASAYALKQHEDLSLQHPHGGTSKYLETPLLAAAATMADQIAAAVRAGLRA